MVKDAGEPVKNFVEMSKTIRNLRTITAILPMSARTFLKSAKNCTPILNLLNSFFKDEKEFTYNKA